MLQSRPETSINDTLLKLTISGLEKRRKMQSPDMKRSFLQRNGTYFVIVPLIIGLHIGWFTLQQRYVPVSDRHDHPLVRLYKKFTT